MDQNEFSAEALWLLPEENGNVQMGLTAAVKEQVGSLNQIELLMKQHVQMGQAFLRLTGSLATVEIEAPISGRLITVNQALVADPSRYQFDQDSDWLLIIN
ncbi:hypothetical protein [Levilactobacillus bambusae]|uniref:Glycine cleavage system protein H n=1 Tax=Levilactobacillus bambusae TaxID=2024736 RepID=A0A2V1MYG1_9LACO|nr:hypothetical protein [Levilactobacillus bambusae]PWG00009.1 hypothetical protein DCM90_03465 [Levilactobacillus bambusae]